MSFFVAVLIVAFTCSAITIKTLVGYSGFNIWFKLIVSLLVIAGWSAPAWVGLLRRNTQLNLELYSWLHHVGYFLFGICFIMFMLILVRDIFWLLSYGMGKVFAWNIPDPWNVTFINRANLVVVAISLVVSLMSIYAAIKVPAVKTIVLTSDKVDREHRFVSMTDLHLTRLSSTKRLEKVVEKVNSLNPEAVFLVGDIVDDKLDSLEKFFVVLQQIKAPVYASSGNHELYVGMEPWRRRFEELGFTVLMNQGKKLENSSIFVGGIPDLNSATAISYYRVNFPLTYQDSKAEDYRILLSHYPNIDKYKFNDFDLQLSGHTHGGQIFPFHIPAKSVNKYLAGRYKVGNADLYVSRGVGYWGPAMRLFAPSEIDEIIIKPSK